MYKVTLNPKKGKSYDVGGTVFKAAVPRTVSDKLGEYLKNNDSFEVVEQLHVPEDINEGQDTTDHVDLTQFEQVTKIYTEAELEKLSKSEQHDLILSYGGDASSAKNQTERVFMILQLQEEATKPEGE